MALIELELPWDSQPQDQAQPRGDVPLLGLWLPGQAESTGRHGVPALGPASGVNIGAGQVGRRWHNASTQTSSYIELLADSSLLPTNTCTIIVIGRQLVLNNGGVGIDTTTAAEKCGISIANTSGQIDWDFGGTSIGTTRLRSAALSNFSDRDVWACTTGQRGMEVWRNGVLVASNGANPTRSASTARWGIGLNVTTVWSGTVNTAFAYYGAALSAAQLSAGFLARLTSPNATFDALFEPEQIPIHIASAAPSFKPAWAIGSNAIIGAAGAHA